MPSGPVKDAYVSWREQRTRCYNFRRQKFKYYGAKGIRVVYSSRDFISWWIREQKRLKIDHPTISRIDHSGDYAFGNVKLESRSDNSRERNHRVPPHFAPRPVWIEDRLTGEIHFSESLNSAARKTGLPVGRVYGICKSKNRDAPRRFMYWFSV